MLRIRPVLDLPDVYHSKVERFQNITLRPILKLQHELTLSLLQASKNWRKLSAKIQSRDAYMSQLEKYMSQDVSFRNQVVGCVVGMMTAEEVGQYIMEASTYNKRIMSMQVQRYADTMYPLER